MLINKNLRLLPNALWGTLYRAPHGNTATAKAANLTDEVIGLLQSGVGVAGKCRSLDGGSCHGLVR